MFGNGKANPASRTSSTTRAHLTETTFASLPISALTKRAIAEVLCYQTLTKVQAETLPLALQGIDLIAKARTGTGKTVAFLLPTIERLLAAGARPGSGVQAVANAKSSTGRLDLLTRLITDGGAEFDRIAPGYNGPLYAEICPRSFSASCSSFTSHSPSAFTFSARLWTRLLRFRICVLHRSRHRRLENTAVCPSKGMFSWVTPAPRT